MAAVTSTAVEVDDHTCGEQWSVVDIEKLANTIALITLGQAEHAAVVLGQLSPGMPVVSHAVLFEEAREQMNLAGKSEAVRYHRDGFLFECISWIAAQQTAGPMTFLKTPHIKSTTQGMDGLMIKLASAGDVIISATIFEDKCTENPRTKFRDEVLDTFAQHHSQKRGAELLATAATLIKEGGLTGSAATRAAGKVLDLSIRTYRAALTVDATLNNKTKRAALFKDFSRIDKIDQVQRIGAMFAPPHDLRPWFDVLASRVVQQLNNFEKDV